MNRQKQYKINGPLIKIQKKLSNLELFGKLHPLIKEVKKMTKDNIGGSLSYRIIERPYHWFPINIQYSAKVTASENEVVYEISEIPFTKANIRYELKEIKENLTEIKFNLQIDSKLIGKGILMNKMISAQDKVMERIDLEMKRLTR